MKFLIKCESVETNTYEVEADSKEEAGRLYFAGETKYVPGTNKVYTEHIVEINEEAE